MRAGRVYTRRLRRPPEHQDTEVMHLYRRYPGATQYASAHKMPFSPRRTGCPAFSFQRDLPSAGRRCGNHGTIYGVIVGAACVPTN